METDICGKVKVYSNDLDPRYTKFLRGMNKPIHLCTVTLTQMESRRQSEDVCPEANSYILTRFCFINFLLLFESEKNKCLML